MDLCKAVTATVENDGKLTIRSLESFALTGGTATTTAFVAQSGGLQDGFANVDISTVQGADDAIIRMDGALKAVNSARADLGAIQNRFESTINNLNNSITNLSAAQSRIQDADYATEVSNMSRAQILQQAGTSVLSQANQVPQAMLSLLR